MPTANTPPRPRLRGGLRIKTAAALLFLAVITLLLALVVGRWAVDNIRGYFGEAFARNHALLTRQRILTVIGRDLTLSQRLAESPLVREWLLDEDDPEKRARVAREMASYRAGFADDNYFLISALSHNYYFGDDTSDGRPTLRYTLNPDEPNDAWFFTTVGTVDDYGINVNPDEKLQVTNIWFNVVVHDTDDRPIGLAGTGFELSRFLQEFIASTEPGVTTLLIDRDGAIMAHPDPSMIEYSSISRERSEKTLFRLLDDAGSRQRIEHLMDTGTGAAPEEARTALVELDGRTQLVALSPIPELDWFVVAGVDLDARRMLDRELIIGAALGGGGLILLLLLLTTLGVDRLILVPLARLTSSVREIANGRYDVRLHSPRRDELGELHRAVDTMAREIRHHTENLEQRVAERTEALATANSRIAEAHDQLTDSIRYASLIQHIILPDQRLEQHFPGEQFVLWLPRDVVGGDFYLYHHSHHGHLLGVVDCAGHGVPGAFMTMIAHAALDIALNETEWHDPAALLTRTDQVLRGMLPTRQRFGQIATNMDMGLCHLDSSCQRLTFAGARMALFWSDGNDCHEISGQRRGLNDRRTGDYANSRVDVMPGRTFYLISDGLFDQAGGPHGYGFGAARFRNWVRTMAARSLGAQRNALREHLISFQGDYPQRDDITVLAFRCATHDNRPASSGPLE